MSKVRTALTCHFNAMRAYFYHLLKGGDMDAHEHDYRINPFETIRSWPATLTAICATCGDERQLGPRGWSLRQSSITDWPKIKFDAPKPVDDDQLRLI